jgi:two-component system, OmpR family, phosphate regulon sensor histidine kinase PhoR
MNIRNRILPLPLSLAISGVTVLFLSLLDEINWSILLVAGGISFAASFLLITITLEFLVFQEINGIYEIFDKIRKKDFKITQRRLSTITYSPLQQLNEEIYKYAENKQKEIDQLIQLEAFRKEFLADVSHELKTPIFAAQGFIHTLLDGAMEDKEILEKFLLKAAKSLDSLDHIVKDLLTLSQMEIGVIKMYHQNFDIQELNETVCEQLEEKASQRNIQLTIENNLPDVWVYADKARIQQVLMNLVSNGIKYGNENGFVHILLSEINQQCKIEVRDNGTGISKKHITRIFERFYRVEKSRSKERGGSGLGLAIVKQILDAHKAEIQVNSKVHIGTSFSFLLPKSKLPAETLNLYKLQKNQQI